MNTVFSKIIIGIDPDITLNGVAVYDTEEKDLDLKNLSFWDLIEEIESYLIPIHVVIEAGHLINKSNWHGSKTVYTAARIGKNVGSNHQVGRLLEQYCINHKISHELTKPLGKVKADYFNTVWDWKGRTNQEQRDAAMLILKYKKQR